MSFIAQYNSPNYEVPAGQLTAIVVVATIWPIMIAPSLILWHKRRTHWPIHGRHYFGMQVLMLSYVLQGWGHALFTIFGKSIPCAVYNLCEPFNAPLGLLWVSELLLL